jgi:hypothetical protein
MKAGMSLMFLFCIHSAFTQTPAYSNVSVPVQRRGPMYLRDVFSTPFESKPYAGIQGSPFLEDKWAMAKLKATGRNELIDSISIKLNIYDNKIHFLNNKGEEMQVALRIEEIKIIDSSSVWMNKIFLSDFDQESGFFEVIADGGKLKLLKRQRMFLWETKPLGSEPQRKLEPMDDLFFLINARLFKASKACLSIKDAFGNNEKIIDYIQANNLRCNKEEDMRKLVTFYASLK